MLTVNFLVLNVYLKKNKDLKNQRSEYTNQELKKEQNFKPKENRRREEIEKRTKVNGIQNHFGLEEIKMDSS